MIDMSSSVELIGFVTSPKKQKIGEIILTGPLLVHYWKITTRKTAQTGDLTLSIRLLYLSLYLRQLISFRVVIITPKFFFENFFYTFLLSLRRDAWRRSSIVRTPSSLAPPRSPIFFRAGRIERLKVWLVLLLKTVCCYLLPTTVLVHFSRVLISSLPNPQCGLKTSKFRGSVLFDIKRPTM